MNSFVDDVLVGLVLFASLGYALVSLGPRTLRRSLLAGVSVALLRVPFFGLRAVARRAAAAAARSKVACGGCDNCGSEPAAQTMPTEVRIPASGIGKRGR